MHELETIAAFDAHVAAHHSLRGVALQGLDLSDRSDVLSTIELGDTAFLGCVVEAEVLRRLNTDGALVFPRFHDLPFRAFRPDLYDGAELFDGYTPGEPSTFGDAFDTRVYRWYRDSLSRHDVVDALAQRIHDHAIDDALTHVLEHEGRADRVVAIMGGHSMRRDDAAYAEVVRLARTLTRDGYVVASGGGPGAMEAANLGGWLAAHPDDAVDAALAMLSVAAGFDPDAIPAWLDAAFAVRERFPLAPGTLTGLAIPTWHYGHEPPNVFASHVAKYFANSIREEGLLAIALAGVVFAPGSAGTIQEVFQDAAQNHYVSFGRTSPMVFLDTDYWTKTKPVYPLLCGLAEGHDYAAGISIHDTAEAVAEAIKAGR